MRLQLDSTGIGASTAARSAEVSPLAAGKSSAASQRGASDSVGLSNTSRIFQSAATSHFEKVLGLTAAVRAGTYSVSPQAVGRSIVSQSGSKP